MKIFFLILLTFTGCTLGPDYSRPAMDLPSEWKDLKQEELSSFVDSIWWTQFDDRNLNVLVQLAIDHNMDLNIAIANVDAYYAFLGVTRSKLFPQLDIEGRADRIRYADRVMVPGMDQYTTDLNGMLGLTWELDVWGRIRKSTEAAKARLLAQEEVRRGVLLLVITNTVRSYFDLLGYESQLAILNETLQERRTVLNNIIKDKKSQIADAKNNLAFEQAKGDISFLETEKLKIEFLISSTENQISALIGRMPQTIKRHKTLSQIAIQAKIPAGMPSELLEQRPDIIQAEQELIAANAEVGSAKAELFPKISLTGIFGYASQELNDLFDSASQHWVFSPVIQQPLFSGGGIIYKYWGAKARLEEAKYNYQRVVINSFREVSDSLILYKKIDQQNKTKRQQVNYLNNAYKIAKSGYSNDEIGYLDLLDTQRSLFNAKMELAELNTARLTTFVNLYKVLGGGWVVNVDQLRAPLSKP